MAGRPTFIDLKAQPPGSNDKLPLPSPRMHHFDGEIPPALSPLDAIAAQSRLMAKQLDQTAAGEKRVSRLPPALVTKSLGQMDRPQYFRSFSGNTHQPDPPESSQSPSSPVVEEPRIRPKSEYPRFSGVPNLSVDEDEEDDEEDGDFITPIDRPTASSMGVGYQKLQVEDYFGRSRTQSPDHDPTRFPIVEENNRDFQPTSNPIPQMQLNMERSLHLNDNRPKLSPPRAPFPRLSNTRPPHHESSDDDYTSSNAGSTFSYPRKLSSSSGMSAHSVASPYVPAHGRSESLNSEISLGGTYRSKSHLNFSRPLSSSNLSQKSVSPSRKASSDTQESRPPASIAQNPLTPLSMDDARSDISDGYLAGKQSYTYSKFSLPRGRMVSRSSIIFSGLSTPHFEWQEPLFHTPPHTAHDQDTFPRTPSPLPASEPNSKQLVAPGFSFDFDTSRPKTPENKPSQKAHNHSPAQSFHSATSRRSSVERGDLKTIRQPPQPNRDDLQSLSSKSNSTIRPYSVRTGNTMSAHLSADDHLAKGIECHERGSYKESTYHLRLAAMQNHPTAMLLYALACRHGWGMRPNQREGVQWLRKAVDSAVLEVADDEDPSKAKQDVHERKTRRAQFALSIYELGVSHLNGWGIEQDKALALRCFEIAGNWGDADALAEAGFCYAEGIGCRKDLKKAARFYRMAESKGMSMVGNSW
ncbi:MAG: hypothetical protein Q9160_001754 [Pyrenula sp. 1 TL-2023]